MDLSREDQALAADCEPELCGARPSPRSSARCEMLSGHTEAIDFFLASFHAGRTVRGHWQFWDVEKP